MDADTERADFLAMYAAACADAGVEPLAMILIYVQRVPAQVIGERLGVRDPGAVIDTAHAAVAKRLR